MPFLSAVDLTTAGDDGGAKFVLTGTFPVGEPFRVYVGPTGTAADPQAVSGKPETDPTSKDGVYMAAYLPVLVLGIYNIFVTNGMISDMLPNVITIVKSNYKSGVFNLRSAFSPVFVVGPRSIDRIPA